MADEPMTIEQAIARLSNMHANLRGALGAQLRLDRRALIMVCEALIDARQELARRPHYVPTVFDPAEPRPARATGEWLDVWARQERRPGIKPCGGCADGLATCDTVDVGVGTMERGNWRCEACGWSEEPPAPADLGMLEDDAL